MLAAIKKWISLCHFAGDAICWSGTGDVAGKKVGKLNYGGKRETIKNI